MHAVGAEPLRPGRYSSLTMNATSRVGADRAAAARPARAASCWSTSFTRNWNAATGPASSARPAGRETRRRRRAARSDRAGTAAAGRARIEAGRRNRRLPSAAALARQAPIVSELRRQHADALSYSAYSWPRCAVGRAPRSGWRSGCTPSSPPQNSAWPAVIAGVADIAMMKPGQAGGARTCRGTALRSSSRISTLPPMCPLRQAEQLEVADKDVESRPIPEPSANTARVICAAATGRNRSR